MADTFEKIKDTVKEAAKIVTDPDTYTGEKAESRDYEKGGKEPKNPEDIASLEPTAVKRDKNQGSSGDPV
jgi:hypothetical protein